MTLEAGKTRRAGPTLEEVAAVAGVSRATVSRVVNGSVQVSGPAREAVHQAIAELGYVPNRAARSLVTRRTDSVALVVSEAESRVFSEPFFPGIVRGISLSATDMQLVLVMAQTAREHTRVENYVRAGHVDGVRERSRVPTIRSHHEGHRHATRGCAPCRGSRRTVGRVCGKGRAPC